MEEKRPEERPVPFGGLLSLGGRAVHPFERFARRALGRDGDLKVLAVLAAFVVYALVEPISAGIERTVSVPVRVLPEGGTTAVVGVTPSAVAVTLRGNAEGFTAFDADALRVELRPEPAEGALSDQLSVGPKDVTNVLDRLRVVAVSPASVAVEYDFMSKMVTTNFFQSIGMAKKAIFLSLTRQLLFLLPCLIILPHYFQTDGVWWDDNYDPYALSAPRGVIFNTRLDNFEAVEND